MNGPSQRTDRKGPRALALAGLLALWGCTGGPHPLPPDSRGVVAMNTPPTTATTTAASSPTGLPSLGADNPNGVTPASGAAGSASTPPPVMTPSTPAPAAGASAPQQPSTPTSTTPPATTPPPSSGAMSGAAGATGGAATGSPSTCVGTTAALAAGTTAPSTMLLVLDRSVDMASDFQGAPRWQRSAEALTRALTPRASALTLGAVLYPSAQCGGSDILCQLQGGAMCAVSSMASQDQVAFQPASNALSMLSGANAVYAPVTADGVPLGESLQRADSALGSVPSSVKPSVVIIASSAPSCSWDAARASAILKRWNSERGVRTFVIALPGTGATSDALRALAEAGGTGDVRSPQDSGALEAMLQSVAYDSLASCSLELDPPVSNPSSVEVRVTEMGSERSLPRTSTSGEALWTISADGKTVTLLGSACDAAKGGDYDAIRIVLGCANP